MHKVARTIASAFLLLLIIVSSAWGDQQEPRLITVTGDADVQVIPDEVILTVGVETWDRSLGAAKSRNDERVKKLLALARDFKIKPQHVQTDQISIEPRYKDGYEKSDFIGYFVRKSVEFTLKDISRFEDLLTGVLQSGANYVHGIQFRTTSLRKYRDQARALAIKAAREKASDLAKDLGQKVGKPHSIREENSGWWSWYNSWWGSRWGGGMSQNVSQGASGASSSGEGSFAPGQITVNARVSVSFELE